MQHQETLVSRRGLLAGTAVLAAVAAAGHREVRVARADESGAVTYAAVEPSMKGDITVFTTIANGAIAAVEVLDDVDTDGIRQAAVAGMGPRIVDQQNVDVDAVAGATITSMAIAAGVRDALGAAGLEVASFEKGSDAIAADDKEALPDEEVDVVIVGAGMAGLSAAIDAARSGARVLVLEKLAYIGGSTRVCGGGLWAMGSSVNERIGADCSAGDYIAFMQDWSAPSELNVDLMQTIHDVSGTTFDYLYDWGLPVTASGWSLGNPEAKLTCFWSTAGVGRAWETGESGIADFMATRAEQDGAQIRLNSAATALIVEGDSVAGVEVEDPTSTYAVRAKSVILTSGGFTRNAELIEKYAPEYADAFAFTGAGSTGDGLVMGETAGAQVVGTGMMGLFGLNPNLGYYGSFGNLVWQAQVTVNAEGETFGMEGAFYGKTLKMLLEQTGACGYGICDATNPVLDRLDQAADAGCVGRYETLDELAAGEGIDAQALAATCKEAGIEKAPFYCVVKRPLFIGSIPGLKVSGTCEVLDGDDEPIAGLYAAGELVFGNVFNNAYPCSGTGVGTSCYTGVIAARAALGL